MPAAAAGWLGACASLFAQPTVEFSRSIQSGYEHNSPVAVELTLGQPAAGGETVDIVTTGSTAASPSDYSLSTTQVIFTPGAVNASILIHVVNDSVVEPPPFERVTLTLTNSMGVAIGNTSTSEYQIVDNDSPIWPGDIHSAAAVTIVDQTGASLGENSSGATLQPAAGIDPAFLWIVKNNPPTLHRLVQSGATWGPSAGWPPAGLTMRYVNGSSQYPGAPDSEGVCKAAWNDTSVYVCSERNGSGTSRLSVLRYDTAGVTSGTSTRDAAREWVLTHVAGNAETIDETVGANGGLEGITWIPDAYLVSRGFKTDAGITYNPAASEYANHGTGLFVVSLEDLAILYVYALKSDGTFKRVARVSATGLQMIVALEFDRDTGLLWAACDNSDTACGNKHAVLEVDGNPLSATHGRLVLRRVYNKPLNLPPIAVSRNFEGLAIAPESSCAGQTKSLFWVNDSGTAGQTLFQSSMPCGCGIDADTDGADDCNDDCPVDPLKTSPGVCGCGRPDTAIPGDFDLSGAVDGLDISIFVDAVLAQSTSSAMLCAGDFNHDLIVDSLDVDGMTSTLINE